MLKTGQTGEVLFTDYTADGLGVCRLEGCAVFVPNAIAGERCEIRVTKAGKTAAWGKIEKILTPSPHRVPRGCPYAKVCGGCQFWHMDYEEELRAKAARVRDALERIGGVRFAQIPIHGAADPTEYRNKAIFQVAERKGRPVAGFYKNRTHEVVSIDRCRIQSPLADRAKDAVLAWMNEQRVPAYDEKTKTGLIRGVFVRVGFATGQVLVCVVATGERLPFPDRLIEKLKKTVKGLASVVLCVNTAPGNVVLSDKYITLYGTGTIEDVLCGSTFRLSPKAFYQVNRDQAERLYALAVEAAGLTGHESVLDLYCGAGTITLALAKHAARAVGVEVVPQAVADAKENAKRNGVGNVEFRCADAGEAAAQLAAEGRLPDVIVVDPPRKGLAPDVIDAMVRMAPQRIVYVSCDPATLARDVNLLTARGYRADRATAVDLFPRTAHVETVVRLSRQ